MRRRPKIAGALSLLAAGAALVAARRSSRRTSATQAGYPPFDVPKQIADDLWTVDSAPINALGLKLPVRMTIVRLQSGDVVLHSPTRHTRPLAEAIEHLGPVRHLIAPSFAHWTFVEAWQHAVPQATTWAVAGLRDRRQVRKSGLRIDRVLGESEPEPWAKEVEQGIIEGGGGFSEAWFFHRASRTLLLTDLIDNMDPAKLPPLTRVAMKLARATSGTTPYHVRAALLFKREQNRDALRGLVRLDPERVVFAHGEWFERDGGRRLRKALNWLIRDG